MTRSKIERMKFFMFLLIFLLVQTAASNGSSSEESNNVATSTQKKSLQQNTVLKKAEKNHKDVNAVSNVTSKASPENGNKTTNATILPRQYSGEGHAAALNPAALLRGFYVFIGLSILGMAYIVFRSFRLNKSRAQMVRKYGILAHRQDVEMRPLPLDEEDDEDTTVFDACNVLTNNAQHQNL